jgi:hypothetical protein
VIRGFLYGNPTVENCRQFCEDPSKTPQKRMVNSQHLCAEAGLGDGGIRDSREDHQSIIRPRTAVMLFYILLVCSFIPMPTATGRESGQKAGAAQGGNKDQTHMAAALSCYRWVGGAFSVSFNCKTLFGTWGRNRFSANLRVYFCSKV